MTLIERLRDHAYLTDYAPAREAADRIEELEAELERERIRLAACGVIALSNTEESAIEIRKMHDEYWSASAGDVANAVNREMKYRKQVAELEAKLAAIEAQEPVAFVLAAEYEMTPEFAFSWVKTQLHDTPLYTNKIGEQE